MTGGAGVQPAAAELRAFWQALPHAPVDEQNCLVLPPGVHFLGDPEYGSKLLKRQHYPALWQQAVTLKEQGIRRLVVRGSPGIGKSWWLFVVLREAARLRLTVVLQHAKLDSRFLFNGNTVLEGDCKHAFKQELRSRDTLYLVDGEQPTLARAWTIAAVSPLREHYWS